MFCPHCADATLTMTERHGIEIDYCPKCRGVWLDRGELDKIIERAAGGSAASARPATPPPAPPTRAPDYSEPRRDSRERYDDRDRDRDRGREQERRYERDRDDDHDYRGHGPYPHHKRRREGFLADLFDFD